jgi:hypothetical protein
MTDKVTKDLREPITQLAEKFGRIWKTRQYTSETAFMVAIEKAFPAARLKRREFARQALEQGKMNSTYQQCLGEFAGFDWQSAAWKTGTVDEFMAELEKGRTLRLLIEDEQFIDKDRIKTDFAMLTLFAPTNAPAAEPGTASGAGVGAIMGKGSMPLGKPVSSTKLSGSELQIEFSALTR